MPEVDVVHVVAEGPPGDRPGGHRARDERRLVVSLRQRARMPTPVHDDGHHRSQRERPPAAPEPSPSCPRKEQEQSQRKERSKETACGVDERKRGQAQPDEGTPRRGPALLAPRRLYTEE